MKRVGCIGLGAMGHPMAMNLLNAGYQLTVYNRTPAKAESLLAAGAQWADSPSAMAGQVDVICLNVTDSPDVEQLLFRKNGIIHGEYGDLVVIDHSTISPKAARQFAGHLAKYGIDFLDAPVSGGDQGARSGTLSVMVGGDEAVFERCMPIFEAVGGQITWMGPSGSGQATKACNQILCAVNTAGAAEALSLAVAEGLDAEKVLQVTGAGAGGSWALSHLGPKMLACDPSPGFKINLLMKDLDIAGAMLERHHMGMGMHTIARSLFSTAADPTHGYGECGTQAVAAIISRYLLDFDPNMNDDDRAEAM